VNVVELLGLPVLEEQLQLLEPMLRECVVTGDDFLDEVTTHLIAAGGKRLRPALTLATATGGLGTASREDLLGGVAVELVHLASLYHDDVMDEATIRRNVESVNSRFGNLVAIVAGDFLLARSAEIAAGLGTEVAGLLAATLGELCQGQVSEVHAAFQVGRSVEDYTVAIAGKTASLMATSCRIGALTAGLPRPQVEAFTTFGRYFGMAFQVRDDILDVVGSATELGKPAGQDLAEGIYTLPVLLALADPVVGPELKPLLGRPLGDDERETARAIVAASGAIDASVTVGRQYAEDAAAAAASCSTVDLADRFAALAHSLVDGLPAGTIA
jgi:heptaprenyl diphosphate synthase